MYKSLLLIVLNTLFLSANEPVVAILKSSYNNSNQHFKYQHYSFYCKAYGVISIDDIFDKAKNNPTCRDEIVKFYNKKPKLQYYYTKMLHVEQMYHLEFRKNMCILYAKGEKSLSEFLLEDGLAILRYDFDDNELNYYFKKARREAQNSKRGIYSTKIVGKCSQEIGELN